MNSSIAFFRGKSSALKRILGGISDEKIVPKCGFNGIKTTLRKTFTVQGPLDLGS